MLAKECYEAYVAAAGGKSLVSGEPLPQWEQLRGEIQHAWVCAAAWVAEKVTENHDCKERLVAADKDAEIERLEAFAHRLADQAVQEVEQLRKFYATVRSAMQWYDVDVWSSEGFDSKDAVRFAGVISRALDDYGNEGGE